ncbi:MAG: spore coat polysaccharide biosynthesis protein SpsF [Chloroflexota bacterium]|nr:spore coat polysaccharide biosynthesis protein SpsF [Chloroflexota bacterium]
MTVLCVLQARVSSSRLPGKVLMPLLGEPMLARQIERIQRAKLLDAITVATSDQPSDDGIAGLCASLGVDGFRGDLDDVLDRFYGAAAPRRPDHVVRLTGDCPLTDPALLDALVDIHTSGGYDYSSNVHPRTYPDGLDAEIFTFDLLEQAWREATSPAERSHVTPWMYETATGIRQGSLRDSQDRGHLRWTVDYPEDYEFVRRVFEALYVRDPAFGTEDVHELLRSHPEIAAINAHLATY